MRRSAFMAIAHGGPRAAVALVRFPLRLPAVAGSRRKMTSGLVAAALALCLGTGAASPAAAAQVGTASGLPIPRYVSLKSDRVNLREGPSKDHRTTWVFQRAGLPVEITAEFETWRRVRDAEGTEGWVLHSLLSGRRTALVTPWEKSGVLSLLDAARDDARTVAQVQPNVIANIKRCDGSWCLVGIQNVSGYLRQEKLWGVYPGEKVE